MRFSQTAPIALLASTAVAAPKKPMVNPQALEDTITPEALIRHAQKLEDFAFETPERNRLAGGAGHNKTVDYIFNTLRNLGTYDVKKQNWSLFVSNGVNSTLKEGGQPLAVSNFDFSPNATFTGVIAPVKNQGCDAADYDASVADKVALISRGTCEFGIKSALAGKAGAKAAIIYNNVEGEFTGGTLGTPGRPEGDYIGTVGVTQEVGQSLLTKAGAGEVTVDITIVSDYNKAYTSNVIAETKGGDHDNVLAMGAHTDSVAAGPGINDDGSGTVGILETAIRLSKYRTKNAVRFGFWSGEEEGLLGSTYYVNNLSSEERDKIRLYLNYDMIASPNFVLAIYDGDGSTFNQTGPPGSDAAEKLYQDWYKSKKLPYTATQFDGRSDYGPFLEANIPCGGIFTGAEEIKTPEEEDIFGGLAGVALDPNYHGKGDDMTNLDMKAFTINTKLIAYATAVYAKSFRGLVPEKKDVQAKATTEFKEADMRMLRTNMRTGGKQAARS